MPAIVTFADAEITLLKKENQTLVEEVNHNGIVIIFDYEKWHVPAFATIMHI